MIKRILDNGIVAPSYYGAYSAPTGTEFARIMSTIAKKNNDKIYDVSPNDIVAFDRDGGDYLGDVNGYRYNETSNQYEFLVENYNNVKAGSFFELHVFIGMRLFRLASIGTDNYAIIYGTQYSAFHDLMKQAEIEGNLSTVKGTIWGSASGVIPLIEYRSVWASGSINKEVINKKRPNRI